MAESDVSPSIELAHSVVEDYLGRAVDIQSISRISGGSVNQVYLYENDLVVRVGSGKRAPATFAKEKWCIERALENEVLTPEVLLIKESTPLVAMLQPKIPGSPGVRLKGEAFKEMWRQLGRYAKLIHSVEAPGFGDRFSTQHVTSLSWKNWMEYQRASLLDDENLWRGLLRRRQLAQIRERFDVLFAMDFEPVLCHANIGERNAIVDRHNKVYLLDWGNAGGYPANWDLAEVVAWNEPEHSSIRCFCEGYDVTEEQFEELKTDLLLIQTWRWLSSIRWAMDSYPDWKNEPVVQLSLARLKKSIRRW